MKESEDALAVKPEAEKFKQLVEKTRSYRRFVQSAMISDETLRQLIDTARLSGSARNGQPWQYMTINSPQLCERIFPHLGWAGYLQDWKGPEPGERPAAYIFCLLHRKRSIVSEKDAFLDLGIATQNLLLAAATRLIMGCRIGAFSPDVKKLFDIPEYLSLELIIALGHPAEQITLDEVHNTEDIQYWRDAQQVHHVPKRSLEDILVTLKTR